MVGNRHQNLVFVPAIDMFFISIHTYVVLHLRVIILHVQTACWINQLVNIDLE